MTDLLRTNRSFVLPRFVTQAKGFSPSRVVSHSRYNSPLNASSLGNSRKWGDAKVEVKHEIFGLLISEAYSRGYSIDDTSFALSVAHIESGFNPDAAAGTTSASGIGQLVDATAFACGQSENNRFSISSGVSSFLRFLTSKIVRAKGKYVDEPAIDQYSYAYAHYHDGGILTEATVRSSKKKIPSLMSRFKQWLVSNQFDFPSTSEIKISDEYPQCR